MKREAPSGTNSVAAMRYVIDGYNLLHALGMLPHRTGPAGVGAARGRLLDYLHARHGDQAGKLAVVFDAARAPRATPPEQFHRGIHVYFALRGEADDLIEELIRHDAAPRELTLVSDDRRLRDAARRRRCPVLRCLDFVERLEYPPAPPPPAPEAPAKPGRPTAGETQRWLREFGDLEQDPALKEWFEHDRFGEAE